MMYIDEVIEAFDEHLDHFCGPLIILGTRVEIGASEAFKALRHSEYCEALNKFIFDNYAMIRNEEETMYIPLR